MRFGIFLAPFHRVGENPTLGFERNLELIQWLDRLGFDDVTDGFGGLLLSANEWASREKTLKSYELLARYVMPRFQGSLVGIEDSYNRSVAHSQELWDARTAALERAHRAFEEKAGAPV
jgi:hypothetical protein